MSTLLKICAVAFIVLVFVLMTRGERHSAIIASGAGIIIFTVIITRAIPIIEFITQISEQTPYAPVVGVLLRALGITIIADATANVCRECSESSLAEKVEFAGRVEVLLLSLPLVSEILELSGQMM